MPFRRFIIRKPKKKLTKQKRLVKKVNMLVKASRGQTNVRQLSLITQSPGLPNALTIASANGTLINGMQLGTNIDNRIGDQVVLKTLDLSYILKTVTGVSSTLFRVFLIYEVNPQQTATTQAFWLLNQTNTHAGTVALDVDQVPENYRILYDKVHVVNNGRDVGGTYPSMITTKFRIRKDLKGLLTKYQNNSNVGDMTDITHGALYFMVLAPAAAQGTYDVSWSLKYNP